MAWLLLKSGPRKGERIEVAGELVIGRERADLTIDDESISRRHVVVRAADDGVEVEDLESKNGTFLDGARVAEVTMVTNSGALLRVGDTEIEIMLGTEAATRVRHAPRPAAAVAVQPFGASSATAARRRRSAATRLPLATLLSFACVAGTAGGLIAYFAAR